MPLRHDSKGQEPLFFFATTGKGIETVLAQELSDMGAMDVLPRPAGVAFRGTLEMGYRAVLWSRTASRIHLTLATFEAPDTDALYEGARAVPWDDHVPASGTLAVDCTSTRSPIHHSGFAALRVKDAVVDCIRERRGVRPSVRTDRPDVRINVHLEANKAILALDLAGQGMHLRGYRTAGGEAPLRENLAAAILLFASWPERAIQGQPFLDPMCGSGTLVIEAALAACDMAPGLARPYNGFDGWLGHVPMLWASLCEEARARAEAAARVEHPAMEGRDLNPDAIRTAASNARRAAVDGQVRFKTGSLDECSPPADVKTGILVTNPPYGVRIGAPGRMARNVNLESLYEQIGDVMRRRFAGWTGYVLAGDKELAGYIGLRASRKHVLMNGAIECRLCEYRISDSPVKAQDGPAWRQARRERAAPLVNRLAKNFKHLSKWARRENVTCYRVYDSDIPEFALAVDVYGSAVLVQEYRPPATVDASRARERREDALAVIPEVLGLKPADVFLRERSRQRRKEQYQRQSDLGITRIVEEHGLRFEVNLTDYLDTGLILDLRIVRAMIRNMAAGTRFLNLFSYTGTASVCAAAGGARTTTTVDMSATYQEWSVRNMEANGLLGAAHDFVRADCLTWMKGARQRFDLVLLAPPTFSRSKRMSGTLDVQRDHADLIRSAAALMAPGGTLLFVASARRFKLDAGAMVDLDAEEITRRTVPLDFSRTPRVHSAWLLRKR